MIYDSKIISKKIKVKDKKNKVLLAEKAPSRNSISNTSIFQLNSEKSCTNNNNINNINEINDDIHILNNRELNDLSNSIVMNNSKNDSSNLILNFQNDKIIEFNKKNYKENDAIKINIDNILFLTRIKLLNPIKIIIIIFIILAFILAIFYLCKIILTLLFISNFKYTINDFKTLTSQYNHIIRYWNHMKTLFILPNSTIFYEFNETE